MVRLALLAIVMMQLLIKCSCTTEVEALGSQVAQLDTRLRQQEGIIGQLMALRERLSASVFFTARMSTQEVPTGRKDPLRFDTVVSNVGKSYNSISGVFTAPVAGDYVFYTQIMYDSEMGGGFGWFTFVIDKSGTPLCVNEPNGSAYASSASCHAATHLAAGEQVYVRRDGDSSVTRIRGGPWCSFSGFLLQATA